MRAHPTYADGGTEKKKMKPGGGGKNSGEIRISKKEKKKKKVASARTLRSVRKDGPKNSQRRERIVE